MEGPACSEGGAEQDAILSGASFWGSDIGSAVFSPDRVLLVHKWFDQKTDSCSLTLSPISSYSLKISTRQEEPNLTMCKKEDHVQCWAICTHRHIRRCSSPEKVKGLGEAKLRGQKRGRGSSTVWAGKRDSSAQ